MILYQYPTRLHYSSIAYGQRQQFDLFGIPILSNPIHTIYPQELDYYNPIHVCLCFFAAC